jgi:3'-phosphoadenosine 5'-phosphosulfate sulfotransferase (PAPS reductase)/FAD synthetase
MTGMRANEGGLRAGIKGCAIFHGKALTKFHPLLPLTDDFINWYIKERGIELCRLYYPPFNFERTGCKGCPYSLDLQKQLDIMAVYLPEERKQCERIWSEVYKEYRRIHYRLEPTLFDNL